MGRVIVVINGSCRLWCFVLSCVFVSLLRALDQSAIAKFTQGTPSTDSVLERKHSAQETFQRFAVPGWASCRRYDLRPYGEGTRMAAGPSGM